MTGNPKISICIPTCNGEKYLRECLDSVLAQSYQNMEIVIVDDRSTDGTVFIINEYLKKDSKIILYRNPTSLGLAGNWNKCMELSGGEWIKFVFQDDYIAPDCIEKMLHAAVNGESLIACKRTFLVDDAADSGTKKYYEQEVVTFYKLGVPDKTCFISPERISRMAAGNICMNFIGEPTSVLFNKKLINTIGLFNRDLAQICDLEYCLRIAANYGVTYLPEPLTMFRIHSSSATSANLSAKTYTLANIDTIIMTHQLLYDSLFTKFRSALTCYDKIKLQKYFAVRVYESCETARLSGLHSEQMKKFDQAAEMYPAITAFKHPTVYTQILYKLVKLRRKIRSITNG